MTRIDAHAVDVPPDSFGGKNLVSRPLSTGIDPSWGQVQSVPFPTVHGCPTTHGAYWATADDGFVRMGPIPGMMDAMARRVDRPDRIGTSRMERAT